MNSISNRNHIELIFTNFGKYYVVIFGTQCFFCDLLSILYIVCNCKDPESTVTHQSMLLFNGLHFSMLFSRNNCLPSHIC
jgi:hypothetical protein